MSRPLEHDYIGLAEACPMERSSEKLSPSPSSSSSSGSTNVALNLKETELRLGLPGSMSPERNPSGFGVGVSIFGKGLEEKPLMSLASGSKRGFSDANIDGSCGNGKWVFSEVDLGKKGPVLFSHGNNGAAMKEGFVAASVPQSSNLVQDKDHHASLDHGCSAPPSKAQVVGWPPVGSFRRNTMASNPIKIGDESEGKALYVKVSMDGAPYLRKVDLKTFSNYMELSSALEKMFSCFTIGHCSSQGLPGRDVLSESRLKDLLHGSEYVLTYEDRDSDWMLVGDVPWEMFTDSCKRLRIMKGSEAIGLAPRAMEKCKNRN